MATTMDSHEENISAIFKGFSSATRAPEKFISFQKKLGDRLISNTKQLFDFVTEQSKEHSFPYGPLDELLTDGFDEEQIWQEIELHNEPSLKYLLKNISNVVARKHKLTFQEERQTRDEENELEGGEQDEDEVNDVEDEEGTLEDEEGSSEDGDDSETNFDIDDLEEKSSRKRKMIRPKRTEPSEVDDKFFKLSEMEAFLEMEDAKEEKKRRLEEAGKEESDAESSDEEDEFNYFDELPSSSEEDGISDGDDDEDDEVILSKQLPTQKSARSREMRYKDYFPDPGKEEDEDDADKGMKKKVQFEDLEDGEKEEGEEENPEDGDGDDDDDDDHLMEDAQLRNYLAMKAAEESESEGEDADDILGRSKPDAEKSSFERRQERLKKRIEELEEANVAEKPWQLIGEVAGRKRPENSLLEERLDFEVASKPAPVITEETTASIETIIKQRILDQAWDDVEKKIKPKEETFEFKKRITLDQEKSKMSLGEIYEQEYLKKMQGKTDEEEENPAHKEIKTMMDSLFIKLDALSNFHYSPKPVLPEVKIVSNVPAITMEEVQPISVADATLLAPEEIKEKPRSELKGDTEKTQTDRKHERRKKKKGQKLRAKEKERRERMSGLGKPESGGKISKKVAMEKLEKASRMASSKTSIIKDDTNIEKKLLTSSKSFFGKLQEEAASEVKGYQKKKMKKNPAVSSKKLKL